MSELIDFFYLSWRKSSTYVSTQEAEEVAYLCVTTSCITTSCTCKRSGVYVSQPLVPVRGWVSMHPKLLHLQEVVVENDNVEIHSWSFVWLSAVTI
jgi:hypothetical protein